MSSLLSNYMRKEQLLKELQSDLAKLENDGRLKVELEFKSKLEELMAEFDKTASDVISLLDPKPIEEAERSGGVASTGTSRRRRRLKVYKNPNSGEVIETRGGNHKVLKAWKDEHGRETVESWVVRVDD
ncbi:histone-like nucleoid-structuring protein, MvaT/MvaU family [Halomonas halocynthiae]|uniref:histone-like nucleoid-structuring protein, MvaT/MvaU family n=1 Tax=Halomonas halocynthiae TaxID=176290 RepID=UPI0004023FAB|nr:histone-like nucleoid-structuring protein, MvaT/MvaU family [Halomonas halocynthiae]